MAEGDPIPLERLQQLTPKERDCLRLVLENRSSKQIARQLGVSQTSVDTHVRRARAKLGITDRYAAARMLDAWESGAATEPAAMAAPAPSQALASVFRLPPLADLNLVQRLLMIVAGAIAAALLFGLLLTALAAL